MKTQVPCLNDALRHLKSLGYEGVAENDVCCTKLAVSAYEYLGLQDLVQTQLVHETEVRHNIVLICRTMKRNRKISLAKVEPIKGIFTYNFEPRPKTPSGFPSLVRLRRPSCHSPDTIKKSLFRPLLELGRH